MNSPATTSNVRKVRIHLSFDEAMLEKIDHEAKERNITRSALMQKAAQTLVEKTKYSPFWG